MKRTRLRRGNTKKGAELQKKVGEHKEKLRDFFLTIWSTRPHICESCGKPLGKEIRSYMFDHLLEKAKYPEYEFDEDNIFLCCLDCHSRKSLGHPTEKHAGAILNFKINQGI